MRPKAVCGFKTGDMVRAEVPNGKKARAHVGRVRDGGSFTVGNADGTNAILRNSPSRGRLWLRLTARASSPP